MLIHYVIGGLIGFGLAMLLVLIYSLCYASGKTPPMVDEDVHGWGKP